MYTERNSFFQKYVGNPFVKLVLVLPSTDTFNSHKVEMAKSKRIGETLLGENMAVSTKITHTHLLFDLANPLLGST